MQQHFQTLGAIPKHTTSKSFGSKTQRHSTNHTSFEKPRHRSIRTASPNCSFVESNYGNILAFGEPNCDPSDDYLHDNDDFGLANSRKGNNCVRLPSCSSSIKRLSFCDLKSSSRRSLSVLGPCVDLEQDNFEESIEFLNESLLYSAGSRNSISTFKPSNSRERMNSIENYQRPSFGACSSKSSHPNSATTKPQTSLLCKAGPSKALLEQKLALKEDLELDFNRNNTLPCPDFATFDSIPKYDKAAKDKVRRKNIEPKPPMRRNSKLTTEKLVKRGSYGAILNYEGMKLISCYDLTYASQLLSIVMRNPNSQSIQKVAILHADLATDSSLVEEFVQMVTGESVACLVTKAEQKRISRSGNFQQKAFSAPSLSLLTGTVKHPEKSRGGASTGLFKHRASTDSTDSGVGSTMDHTEDQPDSPRTSPGAVSSSSSSSKTSSDRPSTLSTCKSRDLPHSPTGSSKTTHSDTAKTLDTAKPSHPQHEYVNWMSLQPMKPSYEPEFTLFHVGFDILPCFEILKGINVDIHHFTMKTSHTAFVRIPIDSGSPEVGLFQNLVKPKQTSV